MWFFHQLALCLHMDSLGLFVEFSLLMSSAKNIVIFTDSDFFFPNVGGWIKYLRER